MERLIKHAYLYATFSEEDTQLGAVLVQDNVIVGAGWNSHISRVAMSEIEMTMLTCQHSLSCSLLVCPMPPGLRESALIVISGITQLVYHKSMKDLLEESVDVEIGLSILREAGIEITEWNGLINCFKLRYQGKTFAP